MKKSVIRLSDIILAGALVLISVLGLFLLPAGGTTVVIKQGDKIIYEGSLYIDKAINIEGEYENHIVIKGGKAYYEHSTCPNHECERMGAVTEAGGNAACAPNGTMIFVRGESEVDAVVK